MILQARDDRFTELGEDFINGSAVNRVLQEAHLVSLRVSAAVRPCWRNFPACTMDAVNGCCHSSPPAQSSSSDTGSVQHGQGFLYLWWLPCLSQQLAPLWLHGGLGPCRSSCEFILHPDTSSSHILLQSCCKTEEADLGQRGLGGGGCPQDRTL